MGPELKKTIVKKTIEIKHTYELEGDEFDVEFIEEHIKRVYAPSMPLLTGLCSAWNVQLTMDGEKSVLEVDVTE